LEKRGGLRIGGDVELPIQEEPQIAVSLKTGRIIPSVGQQLHQTSMRAFAERLYPHDEPKILLRLWSIVHCQGLINELLQSSQVALLPA
jgi:hypothetical protein